MDDEGVKTKKIKLIENGIFKNIFSNIYDSYKENGKWVRDAAMAHAIKRNAINLLTA